MVYDEVTEEGKPKAFSHKHKNLREYTGAMTYQPIQPIGLCSYDCCIMRCGACPKQIVPNCEQVDYPEGAKRDEEGKATVDQKAFISWQMHQ